LLKCLTLIASSVLNVYHRRTRCKRESKKTLTLIQKENMLYASGIVDC
jgi:hypothetical protein